MTSVFLNLPRFTALAVLIGALAACQSASKQWSRNSPSGTDQRGGMSDSSGRDLSLPAPLRSDAFYLPGPNEDVVGQVQVVIARHEDSLPDLARRHDLGFNEITLANPGVDTWIPGEGTRVVLPTQFILPDAPREGVVLNVATMRLFYYPKPKGDEPPIVITHPVGIGRVDWQTPLGNSKIVAKAANPAWYPPASIRKEHAEAGDPLPKVVPAGPDNPLGQYAMRLSIPGYLIHGTNKRYGIGMRVSHGCVRMYPEDIERLFQEVPIGTPVKIVNQPYAVGWLNGTVYLESHEPLEEHSETSGNDVEQLVEAVNRRAGGAVVDAVDWDKAAEVLRNPRSVPVPILRGTPDYQEVVASAMLVANIPLQPPESEAQLEVVPVEQPLQASDPENLTVYLEPTNVKYPAFAE
jgi:L,D-transpeptidase ErfK/SrfK